MTPGERLYDLIRLRDRIDAEITELRRSIDSETQRLRKARHAARKRRARAKCGTEGGYYRHRRTLKEDACFACKAAHAVAESERNARRTGAA